MKDVKIILADNDIDLIEYLPDNYNGKNIKNLLSILDEEIYITNQYADSIGNQSIIKEATFGLIDWEKILGIQYNPSDSLEDRRAVIGGRLRGFGTTTKAMIQNTAEAFSDGAVDIIEHPEDFSFTVKFVGTIGIPDDMQSFIEMLDNIKPAHLIYDFAYSYLLVRDIHNVMTIKELEETQLSNFAF